MTEIKFAPRDMVDMYKTWIDKILDELGESKGIFLTDETIFAHLGYKNYPSGFPWSDETKIWEAGRDLKRLYDTGEKGRIEGTKLRKIFEAMHDKH